MSSVAARAEWMKLTEEDVKRFAFVIKRFSFVKWLTVILPLELSPPCDCKKNLGSKPRLANISVFTNAAC